MRHFVSRNYLGRVILSILVFILCYSFFPVFSESIQLKLWEATLLLYICTELVISIINRGLLSEVTLFIFSFIIFLAILPIEDLLGIYDFRELEIIAYKEYISYSVAIKTVQCLVVGMIPLCIASGFFKFDDSVFSLSEQNGRLEKPISFLFYIILFLSIPYKLYIASIINSGEYTSLFIGARTTGFLSLSKWANDFIMPAFVVGILFSNSKDTIKKRLIVLSIISFIDIFGGRRATFFETVLFVLWFYNRYIKKIKNNYILVLGIALTFIGSFMVVFRGGVSNNVFFDNGRSVYVVSLAIEHSQELLSKSCNELGIPYVFGIIAKDIAAIFYKITGVISPFHDGQTLLTLNHSAYLGWELTYIIRPDAFLRGNGCGSSYIAEAYLSHGLMGIVFYSLLIFFLVSKAGNSNKILIITLYFSSIINLFEMPRANFFDFLIQWIMTVILYAILFSISNLIKPQKKRIVDT